MCFWWISHWFAKETGGWSSFKAVINHASGRVWSILYLPLGEIRSRSYLLRRPNFSPTFLHFCLSNQKRHQLEPPHSTYSLVNSFEQSSIPKSSLLTIDTNVWHSHFEKIFSIQWSIFNSTLFLQLNSKNELKWYRFK